MSDHAEVLEHLLEGRRALVVEVERLTTAIKELDSVIDRVRDAQDVPAAATASRRATKSIRIHVLEMLTAEDRTFALAEIIDRIHRAGIVAHDDAVRSITVKLLKDGQVERVGRGRYRLVRLPAPGGH
jgi:hypothetical protein